MFTQRISMDCTKEQYEKYLKDKLLKMGYVEKGMYWGRGIPVFTNAADGVTGGMLDIDWKDKEKYGRTYIGSFNAPLFLALAAMTNKAEGGYREYYVKDNEFYSMKESGFLGANGIFRKATKDEIMARFSKIEPDTNYDAAKEFVKDFCYKANNLKVAAICDNIHQFTKKAIEQENAIKLLRENGYKILKPKTWEEV